VNGAGVTGAALLAAGVKGGSRWSTDSDGPEAMAWRAPTAAIVAIAVTTAIVMTRARP
jgi:hypothetical protein